MRRHNGSVRLSPTNLNTFLGCSHASALDYRASIRGEKLIRAADDEGVDLIQCRGDEHEQAHFEALQAANTGEVVWLGDRALDPGIRLTE